jgi:hypothetical protein
MAGRSDFGAEHKHKPIECSQCRMKFSDADILANHQRQFCPKGGKGVLFGRKASAEDMEAGRISRAFPAIRRSMMLLPMMLLPMMLLP